MDVKISLIVSLILFGMLTDAAAVSSFLSRLERRASQNLLVLQKDAIQTGSQQNGQGNNDEPGQVKSLTDNANFINFCVGTGQDLTNGKQNTGGSCNGIVMGQIPAKSQMVSTILISPQHNENIAKAHKDFDVVFAVDNLSAGQFTNADTTYYSAPQQLDGQGRILGHSHVTIQDLGSSFNPSQPLDPTQFVFFKGVNTPTKDGRLSVTVTGGLPAGLYRVCTMASASNHQSVLMPIAQRGAQDDWIENGNVHIGISCQEPINNPVMTSTVCLCCDPSVNITKMQPYMLASKASVIVPTTMARSVEIVKMPDAYLFLASRLLPDDIFYIQNGTHPMDIVIGIAF